MNRSDESRQARPFTLTARVVLLGVLAAWGAVQAGEETAPRGAKPCDETLPALFKRVSPAVVSIAAMSSNTTDIDERFARVVGSGVVIDPAGLVLTNSHVVFGRQVITVTLDDGTTLPARIVGADPLFDIAVIRVTPPDSARLPAMDLGDSDQLMVGEDVFAIGNPFGLEQSLTRGVVSAVNRLLPGVPMFLAEPLIQTDASINPGSSGGPLVNRCGEVIGITTAILPDAQNIGFAIPIDLIKGLLNALIDNGRVIRPWLGVQGQMVTRPLKELLRLPLVDGFLVESVDPGSPAEERGIVGGKLDLVIDGQPVLLGGDIITHLDGAPVDDIDKLASALQAFKVGAKVHATVFRDGKVVELDLRLIERPILPQDIPDKRPTAPMEASPRPCAGGPFCAPKRGF